MNSISVKADARLYYGSSSNLSNFVPVDEKQLIIPQNKAQNEEEFLKCHYLKVDYRTRKFNKHDDGQTFKSIIRIYRIADEQKPDKQLKKQKTYDTS